MSKNEDKIKELESAIQKIRSVCRDGFLLEQVKIMEIYHIATDSLDIQKTYLNDMRTGRK